MARVVLDRLSKTFKGPAGEPVYALREASLVIEDKEFVVLVGPSGCGKTTTLRLIAGLEEICAGSIVIDGQVVNDLAPKDRDIAMVFQNYALYPHMTAFENMAFGLKLRDIPKAEIERRVREAADMLGLTLCLDRKPKALSGGQRQRVAVGRAMVRQPKVFLFDEPLSNLDPQMRVQMRAEIARLHTRLGATMIYVTHDQVEAMTMGDRIVVMKDGMIQQVDEPLRLYLSPVNLFVAEFIGSPPMNFFHGTLLQDGNGLLFEEHNGAAGPGFSVQVAPEHVPMLQKHAGQKIILGLRPEKMVAPAESADATNAVQARVEVVELMGAESYVYLHTGAHSFVARVPACHHLAALQTVTLQFHMPAAHYFDPVSELRITEKH